MRYATAPISYPAPTAHRLYDGGLTLTDHEQQFLFLLKCGINGETPPDGYQYDVGAVFMLSQMHNVLPLIYAPATAVTEDALVYKRQMLRSTGAQIAKNIAFSSFYQKLEEQQFGVIVVKGPVCAATYPNPDLRLCSDFDLIVPHEKKQILHEFLIGNGFTEHNGSYTSQELHLEVSDSLGEGSERIQKIADQVFDGFRDRSLVSEGFRTLSYTDHMLYLIFHAFKHFIGSGFGVRQLVDIMLFAERYRAEIDFDAVFEKLKQLRADGFSYHCFYAAQRIFGRDFSYIMKNADGITICYDAFIDDLLSAGVFGKSTEDRLHSASVVSAAVENEGKKNMRATLFPSFAVMKSRYRILRVLPVLLPFFWLWRLILYAARSVFGKKKVSPTESLRIADSRIDLMKQLHIID